MTDNAKLPFGPTDDIELRFLEYHRANPGVYRLLVKFTKEAIDERARRGKSRKVGIKAALERVRWHVDFEQKDESLEFKINNDFSSRYARLIMAQESELRDVFVTRKLVAE